MELTKLKIGDWYFAVRRTRHLMHQGKEFVAWCARDSNLGEGPLDPDPATDVYFEFGPTADEALSKLQTEVLGKQ